MNKIEEAVMPRKSTEEIAEDQISAWDEMNLFWSVDIGCSSVPITRIRAILSRNVSVLSWPSDTNGNALEIVTNVTLHIDKQGRVCVDGTQPMLIGSKAEEWAISRLQDGVKRFKRLEEA